VLAQTCCYPLATALAGVVTPVASPVYDLPGCKAERIAASSSCRRIGASPSFAANASP
jgi:hypothetical protein